LCGGGGVEEREGACKVSGSLKAGDPTTDGKRGRSKYGVESLGLRVEHVVA
jgi:hypothetical protein